MLSEIKITEMLRADRTRIMAALTGAGELTARKRTQGQRRYMLTIICSGIDGPDYDPIREGETLLRSRLPDAVIETARLWEDDEDEKLKVSYTFTPAPSTDQIIKVEIDKTSFSSLREAGRYLSQLPGGELAGIRIYFRSTGYQTVEPITLLAAGGCTEASIRLMLLGRNIY